MEGPDREGSVGQLGLEQRMLARTRSRVDDLALGANVLGAGRGAVCGDELEGKSPGTARRRAVKGGSRRADAGKAAPGHAVDDEGRDAHRVQLALPVTDV